MAQLILDHGGLFQSWSPTPPTSSLTVQYGFSAGAAVWSWVTGQPIQQAVVVFGQLLNLLAVAAWYPLACRLAKGNRWAGVVAVLIAGLLCSVPGFYSNWGRYAQLAGQTVLPVALWLTWDLLERKRFDWRGALLLGTCLAGMLLCYYRMAFYLRLVCPGSAGDRLADGTLATGRNAGASWQAWPRRSWCCWRAADPLDPAGAAAAAWPGA